MRIANFDNNFSMGFDIYDSLVSSIKKIKDNKVSNFYCAIIDQTNNLLRLFYD